MATTEAERLEALRSYRVMDTAPEAGFDRITDLAAELMGAPMALISLIDDERQWFKAKTGLDACSTPREEAFCERALDLEPHGVMVVEDATLDPRFAHYPAVVGPLNVRFYAGALLTDREGHNLGTLCVIDTVPRPRPPEAQIRQLKTLAAMVVEGLERVRAERRLSEKQRLLALAETMSGIGHWRYDVHSGRILWSDAMYRIRGLERDTFDPNFDDALAFYHPDDREIVRNMVDRAIAEGVGYEAIVRLRRADGELREVTTKATCELDERGEVVALIGVFQDVTEQNRALKSIKRSQARYKLLAENMADVITRIRLDGSSSYISPAIHSLIGYRPIEMAGKPAQAFVYGPDQPLILETFARLGAGQEEATVQHRAAHRDGHPVWVETRFRLIRDEAGRPQEMVAVIRDISDRKALETELRQAREAAEAAAAVKSEFLANMSHELRTPLTSIMGFTGLVAAQTGLPDMARHCVRRIESASRALLCTVNDILDFSKLEAGHVAVEPKPTDLMRLCASTLELLGPQAAEKDLALDLVMQACPDGPVMVDADRVRQILLNLLGNAVKFTAEGKVTLQVGYQPRSGRLNVEVRDTGPGIPKDKHGQLFQRFSQVDGSSTRVHGGTGLGLAICKGLVEAMGGEIGVRSTPGKGSRFWFTLPAPLADSATETAGADAARSLAGRKVMVADDQPANRELARLFLSGAGAELTEATDGAGAVALAGQQPFDIILMDIRMPELDGVEALRRIRSTLGPNMKTPILAYTANADEAEVARLKARGFDGVVVKPVDPKLLIAAVVEACAPRGRQARARRKQA